jgi:hypothetical protein
MNGGCWGDDKTYKVCRQDIEAWENLIAFMKMFRIKTYNVCKPCILTRESLITFTTMAQK